MTPDLSTYDVIVANISGGKDSQVMLAHVVRLAREAGALDRVVAVFADLGAEDEWEGTEDIARYHAGFHGVRFIKVAKGEAKGAPVTLLEHIERRGMWPDAKNRYCTSDLKRDPIATVFTRLVRELALDRPARILNCMGLRAQESTKRALLAPFRTDTRLTNGKRQVDVWLPIHAMTIDDVWESIRESGVKYHPVYDAGMPRLSCRFCVLASGPALVRAAQLDPAGAAKRAALEARMGHTFQNGRSMAQIIEAAEEATARGEAVAAENWAG